MIFSLLIIQRASRMPERVTEARIDLVESEILEKTSAIQQMRISTVAPERGMLKSAEYL